MSGGAVDKIAASYAVCMDCNASEAYKEGQQAGRGASTVVSSAEIVLGAAGTGAALAAIPPTVGGGLVCTGATAGLCALPAGAAVTVEGGVAVAGVAVAGAGSATASYITANPINKHHPWPKYLGGPENQPLLTLPRDLHEKYHAGLDKIFSRYNGSLEWDELTAARQQEILTKLADYNMKFDRDYGTNTTQAFYEALVAAGIIK
jgi:hypothetical protein